MEEELVSKCEKKIIKQLAISLLTPQSKAQCGLDEDHTYLTPEAVMEAVSWNRTGNLAILSRTS